ncbi:hypothetical protein AVEN_174459-1 [Araneus ventricosus]|uniref:Uncharacterized protein n=1 Tax=Araneus ventricosus TaxID=182803 RepID=A0A4Y2SLQ2_ARAVE|nr:hypothetical protein AVEN_174459-1 [Araneus ventricosus]
MTNFFFAFRNVHQLKRDATNEGRKDWHYSISWEWYHPSCSAYFQCNAQNADNPVVNVIKKFRRTGSVAGASRTGRSKTATDEGTSTQVLTAMTRSPTKGT